MNYPDTMRLGTIVRIIDHGTNVQLMCADERGLLSVYLEIKRFGHLARAVKKAGLELLGLQIKFNRDTVLIPAPE